MKRILFVDDEARVLEGLRRMLRSMKDHWEASFVDSGEEALNRMAQQPFDVIVSDMRMPGMDGARLLSEVRRRYPRVVRLTLSGYSDKQMMLRSIGPAHQCLMKPCGLEILREAIDRTCALRELLNSDLLERVVGSIETLPSLPDPYLQLQEELRAEEPSIKRVGRIIEQDVGMTAKVLQLVNSAYFGLRRHVVEPAEAAKLLGTETLGALVLSVHVFRQFAGASSSGLCLERLTHHSHAVAAWARAICRAENADRTAMDHAFLGGLLHDAGKLVLAQCSPEKFRRVLGMADPREGTLSAEKQVFGTTHAEVGAYLLGLWGLPGPLVEAVAFHHTPSLLPAPAFTPLTAVHVANALENRHGGALPSGAAWIDRPYLERAGLIDRLAAWEMLEVSGMPQGAPA